MDIFLSTISDDVWVLMIASLVASACALVGVFLVLRRMAMLGDAISHSVLFGIVVGFLLTGSRGILIMSLSAAVVGLLTAFITSTLHTVGKLQEDASIGVTFTWLFAMGVVLVTAYAGAVDLDQACVLYGEIAFAPFDRIILEGRDFGPRAFWFLLFVFLSTAIVISLCYQRLKLISFDPVLAGSLGVSMAFWHYLLMTLVSLVTVASFDAVGAILVVALLVTPANTAFLVSRSLLMMLVLSLLFANIAAVLGFYVAVYYDASISASIALMSGAMFCLILFSVKSMEWLYRCPLFRRQVDSAVS